MNIDVLQYSICNFKYSIPKENTLRFNNGSKQDFKFTIEEFKRQFTCLGKNTEEHTTFSVLIEKEAKRIRNI